MAFIVYKEAYNMFPHTWIIENLIIYQIFNIKFISENKKNLKVQLAELGKLAKSAGAVEYIDFITAEE